MLLEVSTLQGPELHLDVSALQRSVLLLEVSATGLSFIWTCLHTTEKCTAPGGVYTTGACWAASGRVCTTEECTAPGGVCHRAELHLLTQRSVLRMEVSATEPELHLDVSALRRYSMCLIHRDQCILIVERVCFASKIISLLSIVFASHQN